MSLQTDLIAAFAAVSPIVAGGRVYPQAAPADAPLPFVIYRITSKDPLTTLNDSETLVNSIVSFESYADDYAEALAVAETVKAAIAASGLTYYKISSPGEDYVPPTDDYMEPVYYGFWHT
jgi:hypothetical protein